MKCPQKQCTALQKLSDNPCPNCANCAKLDLGSLQVNGTMLGETHAEKLSISGADPHLYFQNLSHSNDKGDITYGYDEKFKINKFSIATPLSVDKGIYGSLTLHDGDMHCGNVYATNLGFFAGFKDPNKPSPSTATSGLRKDGIFTKDTVTASKLKLTATNPKHRGKCAYSPITVDKSWNTSDEDYPFMTNGSNYGKSFFDGQDTYKCV